MGVVLVLAGVAAAPGPPGVQDGLIDRVGEPVEQWRTDIGFDSSPMNTGGLRPPSLWLTDDAVIVAQPERIEALDGQDGSVQWDAEGEDLECHLSNEVILCASGGGSEAELVRLHTADGEIERTPSPGLHAALDLDGAVLTIRSQEEALVISSQGQDGGEIWSSHLEADEPWPTHHDSEENPLWLNLDRVADQVLVGVSMGPIEATAALDADTGAAQDLNDGTLLYPVTRGPDQAWLVLDGYAGFVGRIGPDGYPTTEPVGSGLIVDDDAASDLTFERDETSLTAVSRRTGVEAWSRSQGGESPAPFARLGDVLTVTARGNLVGLDLDSGEALWFQDGNPWQFAWSDGRSLAYLEHREGSVLLSAIDTETGEQIFQVNAGQGLSSATTMTEDRLVLLTDDALSLWAW